MAPLTALASRPTVDICSAYFNRARATDLVILSFGIGLGILFYAIAHDVILRRTSLRCQTCSPCECAEHRGRQRPLALKA